MDALIVSRTVAVDVDRSGMRSLAKEFGQGSVLELPLADGAHILAGQSVTNINFYTPQEPASFSNVAVGQSVALLDGNWARAFLRYCLSLVKPGGHLLVARNKAAARGANGFMSAAEIAEFLSLAAERLNDSSEPADSGFLVFRRGLALPDAPLSVLSPFLDDCEGWAQLLMSHFVDGDHEMIPADSSRFTLEPGPLVARSDAREPLRPSKEELDVAIRGLGSEELALLNHAKSINSYLIDGMRYKPAILRHIARTCVNRTENLSIADVGSAYGLLPVEMCFESRPLVSDALAVEKGYGYARGAMKLFELFEASLAGRAKFALSPAEHLMFDRPYDVISFIGSLLYVDKLHVRKTLENAWDEIISGGVLVVHENIVRESYVRDRGFMFTAQGIDELLGRFGGIRYFLSTGAVEIPPDKVGDKTVFRVVVKK